MFYTANAFMLTVLTYYNIYRYVVQHNPLFQEYTLVHFQWQIAYLILTLVIFNATHSIECEVSKKIHLDVIDLHSVWNDTVVTIASLLSSLGQKNISNCTWHYKQLQRSRSSSYGMHLNWMVFLFDNSKHSHLLSKYLLS